MLDAPRTAAGMHARAAARPAARLHSASHSVATDGTRWRARAGRGERAIAMMTALCNDRLDRVAAHLRVHSLHTCDIQPTTTAGDAISMRGNSPVAQLGVRRATQLIRECRAGEFSAGSVSSLQSFFSANLSIMHGVLFLPFAHTVSFTVI